MSAFALSESEIINDKWDEIERMLNELDGYAILSGALEGVRHNASGLPLAGLAAIHQYGSERANIPARPFMSQAADMNFMQNRRGRIKTIIKKVISRTMPVATGMDQIGKQTKLNIKRAVEGQQFTPLKPSTIAWKESTGGDSRILIETYEMLSKIDYKVEKESTITDIT